MNIKSLNKKPLIVFLIIILAFTTASNVWRDQVEELLLKVGDLKKVIVSRMAYSLPIGSEEDVEIVLPGITSELIEGWEKSWLTQDVEKSKEQDIVLLEQNSEPMSLAEIQAEVDRIEKETDIIAVKVAELVKSQTEKQAGIAEIQLKINEISEQIELLTDLAVAGA